MNEKMIRRYKQRRLEEQVNKDKSNRTLLQIIEENTFANLIQYLFTLLICNSAALANE